MIETETPDRPYPRTSCACADCQACCTEQPGSLAAGDLERIAEYLEQPVSAILHRFWASPGALLLNTATGELYRQGTITPQLRHGRCVFLDREGYCSIHPVAPAGCALFDTHMEASIAQPRSLWLARTQADEAYQSLRRTLQPARSHQPRGY
jgi:Fe-S-cluster containining protein